MHTLYPALTAHIARTAHTLRTVLPVVIALMFILVLTGCATKETKMVEQAKWQAYYTAVERQQSAPQQKQFELELTEDGKVKGLAIYAVTEQKPIAMPKQEIHPGWKVLDTTLSAAIPYLGFAGTAHVIGNSLTDIVRSGRGDVITNTTNTGSHNTAGADFVGGDRAVGDAITSGDTISGDTLTNSGNTTSGDTLADSGNTTSGDTFADSGNTTSGDTLADSGNTFTDSYNPVSDDSINHTDSYNPISDDSVTNTDSYNPVSDDSTTSTTTTNPEPEPTP